MKTLAIRTEKQIAVWICLLFFLFVGLSKTQAQQSPLRKEAARVTSAAGSAADAAVAALRELQGARAFNSLADIKRTLVIIDKVQKLELQGRMRNDELVKFVQQNRARLLRDRELKSLPEAAGIYGDTYKAYRFALWTFLERYKRMLEQGRDNFDAIISHQSPAFEANGALYSEYTNALEKQNNAFRAHVAFLKDYGKQHPNISKVLSGVLAEYGN